MLERLEILKKLIKGLDYQEFMLEEDENEITLCAVAHWSNLYKYTGLAPVELIKNYDNKEYLKKYAYDDIYLKFPVLKKTVAEVKENQEEFENQILAIVTRYNRFAYDEEIKNEKITMNFFGWLNVEVDEKISLDELKNFRKNISEEAEMFLKGLILNKKRDYMFIEDGKNIYIKYENQEEEVIYDKEKEKMKNWLDIQIFIEFLRFINNEEKIYKKDFVVKNLKKSLNHQLKVYANYIDDNIIKNIVEKYYNVPYLSIYEQKEFEDFEDFYLIEKDLEYKHSWAGNRFCKTELELIYSDSEKEIKFGKNEEFIFSDNGEIVTEEINKTEPVVYENPKLIIILKKKHYKNDFDSEEVFKESIGIFIKNKKKQ